MEYEIEDDEQEFLMRVVSGVEPADAARGTIVPVDASKQEAARQAQMALQDGANRAWIVDGLEEVNLTRRHMFETLKRNMDTHKYGLNQRTGEAVDLGDDGMTQLTAVKLMAQMMGALGGGAKQEPVDRNPAPAQVNIIFPGRNIRSKKEDVIIDGDDSYTASA